MRLLEIAEARIGNDRSHDLSISGLIQDPDPSVVIQTLLSLQRGGHPAAEELEKQILALHSKNVAIGLSVLKFESQQHVPLTLRILQKGKLKDTNRVVIYLMDDQSKATLDWLSEPTGSPPAGILDRLNSGQQSVA